MSRWSVWVWRAMPAVAVSLYMHRAQLRSLSLAQVQADLREPIFWASLVVLGAIVAPIVFLWLRSWHSWPTGRLELRKDVRAKSVRKVIEPHSDIRW